MAALYWRRPDSQAIQIRPEVSHALSSDLVSHLTNTCGEDNCVDNSSARIHVRRVREPLHHEQQQQAEKSWAPIESKSFAFQHSQAIKANTSAAIKQFHEHPRPDAARLIEQDRISRRYTSSQRPYMFPEMEGEHYRRHHGVSHHRSLELELKLQQEQWKIIPRRRPGEYL